MPSRCAVGAPVAFATLLCCAPTQAADLTPRVPIPTSGKTIERFVPAGYRILERHEADFNGDGLRDAVLIVEFDDPDAYDRPRPLLILFRQPEGGYRLSARSDSAVDTAPPGVHGDHFYGVKVRGRTIVLEDGGTSGAGSSGQTNRQQYRYQNGGWSLIGTQQHAWLYPSDVQSDTNAAHNARWCPELHLSPTEVCRELDRSTNFNTREEISKWDIYPAAAEFVPGENHRTQVMRRTLPRMSLGPLDDAARR